MPDLDKIRERLKWGDTIDDVYAVNLHYREDIQALLTEVARLTDENKLLNKKLDFIKSEVSNPELRRAASDLMDGLAELEHEARRMKSAILEHKNHCLSTRTFQKTYDEKLWEVLND